MSTNADPQKRMGCGRVLLIIGALLLLGGIGIYAVWESQQYEPFSGYTTHNCTGDTTPVEIYFNYPVDPVEETPADLPAQMQRAKLVIPATFFNGGPPDFTEYESPFYIHVVLPQYQSACQLEEAFIEKYGEDAAAEQMNRATVAISVGLSGRSPDRTESNRLIRSFDQIFIDEDPREFEIWSLTEQDGRQETSCLGSVRLLPKPGIRTTFTHGSAMSWCKKDPENSDDNFSLFRTVIWTHHKNPNFSLRINLIDAGRWIDDLIPLADELTAWVAGTITLVPDDGSVK